MAYRYDVELAALADSLPELDLRDIPAARDGMARRRGDQPFERPGSLRVSEAVTLSDRITADRLQALRRAVE